MLVNKRDNAILTAILHKLIVQCGRISEMVVKKSEGVPAKRTSTVKVQKSKGESTKSNDRRWKTKEEKSRLSRMLAFSSRQRFFGIPSKAMLCMLRLTEGLLLLLVFGVLLLSELPVDAWTDERALFVFFPVTLLVLLLGGVIIDLLVLLLTSQPHVRLLPSLPLSCHRRALQPPTLPWLTVLGVAMSATLTTSMWTLSAVRIDYIELVKTPDNGAAFSAAAVRLPFSISSPNTFFQILSASLTAVFIVELMHFSLARNERYRQNHYNELKRFGSLWRQMAVSAGTVGVE